MPRRSQETLDRVEAKLEIPMLIASALVLPAMLLQDKRLGQPWETIGDSLNWITWFAFAFELVILLAVAPNRWEWIKQHPLEVAIVLLTPPFFPEGLAWARLARLFRLMRVLRVLPVIRKTLNLDAVRYAGVLALIVVFGGGLALTVIEPEQKLSASDGIWWAIVTVTTVGYGDIAPQTETGRLIGVAVMLTGIGLVSFVVAAAANQWMESQGEDDPDAAPAGDDEDRLAEMAAEVSSLRREIQVLSAQLGAVEPASETAPSAPNGGRTAGGSVERPGTA